MPCVSHTHRSITLGQAPFLGHLSASPSPIDCHLVEQRCFTCRRWWWVLIHFHACFETWASPFTFCVPPKSPERLTHSNLWKHTWKSWETCYFWTSTLRQFGSYHEKTSLGIAKGYLWTWLLGWTLPAPGASIVVFSLVCIWMCVSKGQIHQHS